MHIKDPTKEKNTHVFKRIQKLPLELANQIAAGEVVERPASVLKELLENSIDAGSSQIDISIERGGVALIRLQDNGCGICQEDLELALSQHATSKILSLTDLERVSSYGFRGEALASISGVSRLSLCSTTIGQSSGFTIQKEGRDGTLRLTPAPYRPGTTVEVRDLFYNTPARRHFLRSDKTENLYLEELFKRVALSQPSIAFNFRQDERPPKRLVACRTIEAQTRRVAELCGQMFIKTAHYMEAESNGLKLRGWLGDPAQCRAQADLQYFYVNGRIVRDKVLNYALKQAYQEYSVPGRHSAYVLFFELDPQAVDVNVHPTKHEVRFREARSVTAFLIYSIREALTKTAMSGNVMLPNVSASAQTSETDRAQAEFTRSDIALCSAALLKDVNNDANPKLENENKPFYKYLAILGAEFLLCENSEKILIVDIKAVYYASIEQKIQSGLEQLRTGAASGASLESKPLLMPQRIEFIKTKLTIKNIDMHPLLEKLGFEWTILGPDSVLIRKVPFVIRKISAEFEGLIQILFSTSDEKTILELISDYCAEYEKTEFSLDQAPTLMQKLKEILQFPEIDPEQLMSKHPSKIQAKLKRFYREIDVKQLRTELFKT